MGEDIFGLKSELQVLLVGINEEWDLSKSFLNKKSIELLNTLIESLLITRINDENHAVGVIIIVLPVWSDSLLTSNVPHIEFKSILGL